MPLQTYSRRKIGLNFLHRSRGDGHFSSATLVDLNGTFHPSGRILSNEVSGKPQAPLSTHSMGIDETGRSWWVVREGREARKQ